MEYEHGLIRNHYTGSTFKIPGQAARESAVRLKHNVNRPAVRGKSLTVVDDSIVRGTTSSFIARLLREAGATEVHMRIPSPPVRYSCFWGIATHHRELLMAARCGVSDMCHDLGLDSLEFLPVGDFAKALGDPEMKRYCYSCFTGKPPVPGHVPPCPNACGGADE